MCGKFVGCTFTLHWKQPETALGTWPPGGLTGTACRAILTTCSILNHFTVFHFLIYICFILIFLCRLVLCLNEPPCNRFPQAFVIPPCWRKPHSQLPHCDHLVYRYMAYWSLSHARTICRKETIGEFVAGHTAWLVLMFMSVFHFHITW
jgi:hypothetical protein